MIDYEYPNIFITEGTQKELLITDGTVTIDGTDYEVSDETVLFENNDLELEAFELSQTLCSEMELQFGFCGTSKVSFTVRKTYEDSIVGTTVKVYIIPNHDASKMLQLGVFKIYEDKQSNDHARHNIVGYDKMYQILNRDMTDWYDDILQDEEAVQEMSVFRYAFTSSCGVDEEETTLVNDDLMIRRTIEKDRISGADIIKAICEINGVFGVISNEGKFRYVQLQVTGYDPSMEIPVTDYMDLQYADYWCQPINQLTIIKDSTVKYTAGAITPQPNNYIIAYNSLITDKTLPEITQIANRIYRGIQSLMYRALTINAIGNPVREVGDRIAVRTKDNHILYTYIFQRKLTGIQALRDTYIANGEEYLTNRLTDKSAQYSELSNQINEITQGGGSSSIIASEDFVERIRNIGFRLLDEPSNVSLEYDAVDNEVSLKWSDPADIATNEPCPATWAGTVVVRKENSAPLHRWDGTLIVDSTTRDEYSINALADNTLQIGKAYYYGIFPYDTKGDYRFTKVIPFNVYSLEFEFEYTGNIQTWVVPQSGKYLIEAWGAQGGNCKITAARFTWNVFVAGGKGGHSEGYIDLTVGQILHICVGGQGENVNDDSTERAGGYNGGGKGGSGASAYYPGNNYIGPSGGGGGGATHIALGVNNGVLANYASDTSPILLVAGGGGGGAIRGNVGSGGGLSGGDSEYWNTGGQAHLYPDLAGGTQNSGYAFGLGQDGRNSNSTSPYTDQGGEGCGGGGAGWYGGYAMQQQGYYTVQTGAGGSGYIGGVENGTTENGVQEGNGLVKITLIRNE